MGLALLQFLKLGAGLENRIPYSPVCKRSGICEVFQQEVKIRLAALGAN